MNSFSQIEAKLSSFYKKYYKNQLIKGIILFVSLGVSYFLLTSVIEYSFWLSTTGRTVLFWLFVSIETYLLFVFIGKPMSKLLGASKGIDNEKLSRLVGKHFDEVEDKLLNVLQLKQSNEDSELLLASIEKKSRELQAIPFNKAINYQLNLKYVKFAVAPLLLLCLLFFSNLFGDFSSSFYRVMDYGTSYTPPAPFAFQIQNTSLEALQGDDYLLEVTTQGKYIPEEAKIHFQGQEYYLKLGTSGSFQFKFTQVQESLAFYLESNEVRSPNYTLKVMNTPRIQEVKLQLDYPNYTGQQDETINATTDVTVPEGTKVTWTVSTANTDSVAFILNNQRDVFQKNNELFLFEKILSKNTKYRISSSNKNVKDFESLSYYMTVLKDERPKVKVESNIDSVVTQPIYFIGQISDDYGIDKLQLVYQEIDRPASRSFYQMETNRESLQSFFYEFPEGLMLKEGVAYELFFEVFDNDRVNGSKKAQSQRFYYRVRTKEERDEEVLKNQKDLIERLEKSFLSKKAQEKELQEIQNDLQNKQDMNWNDKKKIDNLIKRQQQYQNMMEKQTNNLLQNLDQNQENNEQLKNNKEALKKRIEELKKLKRQEKLLQELERLANKLNKEEITRKTKELAEQNKQQERSLERILELTKRFYVEQKMTQVANKLNELAKKQEKLSQKESPTQEQQKQQQELKKEFEKIEEELEKLDKDNENLKKPMDLPDVSDEQYEVNKEQQKAQENLQQNKQKEAKKSQKKASKGMQKMSQKMMQTMMDMQANSVEENADDLRKILKNLITFSFKQEALMKDFSEIDFQHPDFGKNLKKQNQLKTYFEHIDDSLYVLSMRVPQISAQLQEDLATAHFNLDESLENFTERRFGSGTSNQQYVMTASNNISDFLSDLLNNMNSNMSASGKGKGGNSFSLPNIIKQQQGLSEQMKEGLGKKSEQKNGKKQGKNQGERQQEMENGELYQIFQQQNQLKQQLQDLLRQGNNAKGQGKQVLKSMEQLENEILEKGFSKEVLQRMQNLEYQLLKLDNAALEQNKDKKRKSTTNTKRYSKDFIKEIQSKKSFYRQLEILNRQSLPLQQNYKKKVQKYFSKKIKA